MKTEYAEAEEGNPSAFLFLMIAGARSTCYSKCHITLSLKKIALSFILSAAIIAILAAFEYINVVKIKTEIRFLELTDTVRTKSLQVRRHEQHQY